MELFGVAAVKPAGPVGGVKGGVEGDTEEAKEASRDVSVISPELTRRQQLLDLDKELEKFAIMKLLQDTDDVTNNRKVTLQRTFYHPTTLQMFEDFLSLLLLYSNWFPKSGSFLVVSVCSS